MFLAGLEAKRKMKKAFQEGALASGEAETLRCGRETRLGGGGAYTILSD